MVAALTLTLFTTSLSLTGPAMASGRGGGGGSVSQEKVSTGDSSLDKGINKFYSCVSKTHQDPPTIEKVDNCYYQGVDGSGGSIGINSNSGGCLSADSSTGIVTGTVTGTGSGSTAPSLTSSSHHHKHG